MGLLRELEQKNLDGVIRELTENPTCIDDTTEKGVPLALYAAELGDFSIVKYIVEYSYGMWWLCIFDHSRREYAIVR